jgi:hypothetical protein
MSVEPVCEGECYRYISNERPPLREVSGYQMSIHSTMPAMVERTVPQNSESRLTW